MLPPAASPLLASSRSRDTCRLLIRTEAAQAPVGLPAIGKCVEASFWASFGEGVTRWPGGQAQSPSSACGLTGGKGKPKPALNLKLTQSFFKAVMVNTCGCQNAAMTALLQSPERDDTGHVQGTQKAERASVRAERENYCQGMSSHSFPSPLPFLFFLCFLLSSSSSSFTACPLFHGARGLTAFQTYTWMGSSSNAHRISLPPLCIHFTGCLERYNPKTAA